MPLIASQITKLKTAIPAAAEKGAAANAGAEAARITTVTKKADAPAKARAAEAAAWEAKAAAGAIQDVAADMDATGLADARNKEAAAKAALQTKATELEEARDKLSELNRRKQSLQESAADAARKARQAEPPADMLTKRTRLKEDLDAAEGAFHAAQRVVAQAMQALPPAVASVPVQACENTGLWASITSMWRGAPATPAVPVKPTPVVPAGPSPEESEYLAAKKAFETQVDKLKAKKKIRVGFERLAQEREKEAALTDVAIAAAAKDYGNRVKDVTSAETARDIAILERQAWENLPKAADAAENGLARAAECYKTLGMANERADLDMKTGAAIKLANLNPASRVALNAFNAKPPTQGQTAKTLSGVLATKTQADFLAHMDAQIPHNCSRVIEANGNRKYEYPDGTLVRYKAVDNRRTPPSYSVEVKHTAGPPPDAGPQDVAFKVDSSGRAVPKNPADTNNPFNADPEKLSYDDRCMTAVHHSIP